MRKIFLIALACALLASCATAQKENLPNGNEILSTIDKVNTHWQAEHPLQTKPDSENSENSENSKRSETQTLPFHPYSDNSPFWHNAAYHTGNMEVYKLTKNEAQLAYSKTWAESNRYIGATSNNKAEWRYDYGEKPEYVMFGDWQICFQTYCDLYEIEPSPEKIARAREVMEYQMQTAANDYWWWADGLYMVMPTMTKLYKITGNEQYLDKLHEYWMFAKNLMYDGRPMLDDGSPNTPQHLFYRDGKYIYPKHKSAVLGGKDFWARGCGWVVAGLAKVLQDLPKDSKHRKEFITTYREMCEAVKNSQQPGGYWTRSILDPECAPGPETSGTAFFCYGLAWGINNGVLKRADYLPTVLKAWDYLSKTALQDDGRVGYVQPIGERAIPGQVVDANSTANFGVGAFLLAACEVYRLLTH